MHIKKYQAPDMRRALKKVSDDLGPDAVILSNNKTEDGVELWASIGEEALSVNDEYRKNSKSNSISRPKETELDPIKTKRGNNVIEAKKSRQKLSDDILRIKKNSQKIIEHEIQNRRYDLSQHQNTSKISNHHGNRTDKSKENIVASKKNKRNDKAVKYLEVEFNDVKNDLKRQEDMLSQIINSIKFNKNNQLKKSNEPEESIKNILDRVGFTPRIIKKIIENKTIQKLKKNKLKMDWNDISDVISDELIINENELWHTQLMSNNSINRFLVMGPTGVGKTTTIGKIAHRYILENSNPSSVALITTDINNPGSLELLKSYTKKLGCNFYKVAPGKELDRLLSKLKNKALVLIDTPGLTSADPRWHDYKHGLLALECHVEPVLVLPSTIQWRLLDNILKDYKPFNPKIAAISKLDECVSLGEVLDVIIGHQLNIAYVTDGLSLVNDIHLPKAKELMAFARHLGEQAYQNMIEEGRLLQGDSDANSTVYSVDTC